MRTANPIFAREQITAGFNPCCAMALHPTIWGRTMFAVLRCINARAVSANSLSLRLFTTENEEVRMARRAAGTMVDSSTGVRSTPTIFSRILSKEIPAKIIHEDDKASTRL